MGDPYPMPEMNANLRIRLQILPSIPPATSFWYLTVDNLIAQSVNQIGTCSVSYIMMIIVAALVLGVFLGALVLIPRNRNVQEVQLKSNKPSKVYNKAEVSVHNKRTDCWIIIKNKVYDVSSYVDEHPGGDAILAHAGDDATKGFYGPQHGTRVFDVIEDFCIGDLRL
ncbi:cytochrome B5-like protein isoform X2 [Momordica charantia]|uniref:Cytochrome B5-like protein isoform X2 n=1 Tax=Momordica charantia TaxID=3673 RepID=A0A6J1DMK5_MOMCH|nr:cytochrome B5-like protein isoform X2 [Momordica charantia]